MREYIPLLLLFFQPALRNTIFDLCYIFLGPLRPVKSGLYVCKIITDVNEIPSLTKNVDQRYYR